MKNAKRIIIRADGYKRIGMGHIYRSLTLSAYLKRFYGFDIVFVTRNNKSAVDLIKQKKFRMYPLRFGISIEEEKKQLAKIIANENPELVIVDLLKSIADKDYMNQLRINKDIRLVAFTDDPKQKTISADVIFCSDLNQKQEFYKNIKKSKYYVGFDYIILNQEYSTLNEISGKNKRLVKRVLICMGGSDHHNLTFRVLKALDKSQHDFECDVIFNSSFFKRADVDFFLNKLHYKTRAHYDVDSLYRYLLKADMAITAGGIAHIERLCSGVPGIVLNQLNRQAELSKIIESRGATLNLGIYKNVSYNKILKSFDGLISDSRLRRRISINGKKLVDGRGLARIARIIYQNINSRGIN